MTYPGFPAAGTFPAFLSPFDPTFWTSATIGALYGTVTDPVPVAGVAAVIVAGPWNNPPTFIPTNPRNALFAWTYVNIKPPGFSGIGIPFWWPQIRGPGRAYWGDPGGEPFIT